MKIKWDGCGVGKAGAVAVLALTGISPTGWSQGWQLATNLSLKADLAVKELFDSNVYLQDVAPSPAIPNAAQPFQESMVTLVTPRLALDWKPMPEFNLATSYAPEMAKYHAEPGENYIAHRGALTFSGKVNIVQWEQFNTVNYIDGSHEGLTFGGPPAVGGNAPAIGGIAIRDRRDALVYRNGFRAYHPHGDWFFRPVAWSYIHDFRTDQRNVPYYQNYLDRNDLSAGIDIGYKALRQAHVLVGYRYGFQNETPLPWNPVHYSGHYHRLVVGLEGKLTDWLKVTGVIGPDYRKFNDHVPANFDAEYTTLYYDVSIALTPTKQDTVSLLFRQYEQPAFGAASVYDDITWEIAWRHQFGGGLAVSTGFRAYGGDWLAPVVREDWIYTPSATISYVHDRHLSGELSYSYDSADSRVPNTSGREYTRHLASLTVKYAF